MGNRWESYKERLVNDFYELVRDLLEHEDVLKLDEYKQHFSYTRLRHSIDVAFFSYCIARILGWDCRSVARAGLLHDLFHYDWRDEEYVCEGRNHAMEHPKIALRNAMRICSLNEKEQNIIRRHMWLVTLVPPRYKEGYIVTFVDKYCAVREMVIGLLNRKQGVRSAFATAI